MSDLEDIAARLEIEALRGEFAELRQNVREVTDHNEIVDLISRVNGQQPSARRPRGLPTEQLSRIDDENRAVAPRRNDG